MHGDWYGFCLVGALTLCYEIEIGLVGCSIVIFNVSHHMLPLAFSNVQLKIVGLLLNLDVIIVSMDLQKIVLLAITFASQVTFSGLG